jgi:hypothetical protein
MSNFQLNEVSLEILKNFANINPQVQFKAGTTQRTCNATRNFIADVELPVPVPVDCALYNLNSLLGIIDTCKGTALPSLTFGASNLVVEHEHGEVTLPFAHEGVVAAPPGAKYVLTKQMASFDLPAALWSKIKRTASVLQTTSLQFVIAADKSLRLKLVNDKDAGGETIGWGSYNLPNTVVAPDAAENIWVVKFDALELLNGDYTVEIGDISGSKNTAIFGAFFTLNTPNRSVRYLTSGHAVKSR